jgi:hypothetical protein
MRRVSPARATSSQGALGDTPAAFHDRARRRPGPHVQNPGHATARTTPPPRRPHDHPRHARTTPCCTTARTARHRHGRHPTRHQPAASPTTRLVCRRTAPAHAGLDDEPPLSSCAQRASVRVGASRRVLFVHHQQGPVDAVPATCRPSPGQDTTRVSTLRPCSTGPCPILVLATLPSCLGQASRQAAPHQRAGPRIRSSESLNDVPSYASRNANTSPLAPHPKQR